MLTWAAEYGLQLMLGTGAAGWFALCWGTDRGWWERYRIKETWCQGCDHVQPSTSMRFTDSGLYWCGPCRKALEPVEEPKPALEVAPEYADGKRDAQKQEVEVLRKELAETQAWLAAERAQMKMLQREREPGHWEWTGMGREWVDNVKDCPCCEAARPGAYQWDRSPRINGGLKTWTCDTCGCDWNVVVSKPPKGYTWRRMSGKYHADAKTPRVVDIQLANCTIPLWSPVAASARKHNGNVYCATCEVTGNHLPYECPQRGHATVVTGSGRIKEQQLPIAELVAEGEPKPEWWLLGSGRWVQVPADNDEARQWFEAEDGTRGEVAVRQREDGKREVSWAVDGVQSQTILMADAAYRDRSLAEIADISCKLLQSNMQPLKR